MRRKQLKEYYTIWRKVGLEWLPLRTYLSLDRALELAKDWSIDGQQYMVSKGTGEEVQRFGRPPQPPRIPVPSEN